MGKALLVSSAPIATLASGEECNLFGHSNDTTTEANTQANCTEDATFSNLAIAVRAGNSGTLTLRFRDAGANGNQVVSFASTGSGEDATNTDILSAGDLFNISYADTGSNSTWNWIKANVNFATGHGNFHGAATFQGAVCDVGSSTRFQPLGGGVIADGSASEDSVEWKVRGYDTFEAYQVRVTANARLNTSTFVNRINGGDGTGSVPFATLVTGLVSDTGLADAITDGQTVDVSMTLGAGVEDLTVVMICGTLKSSSNKSECWVSGDVARTASAVATYSPIGGLWLNLGTLTEAQSRIKPGFAAVVSNLRCYLSGNTYASDGTLKLFQNGSAVITLTLTAGGGAAWYENTSDTITIDADDELSFEFDEGGASGSITIHSAGITFAPIAPPAEGGGLPWLAAAAVNELVGVY